jgi:hypothetical protein
MLVESIDVNNILFHPPVSNSPLVTWKTKWREDKGGEMAGKR